MLISVLGTPSSFTYEGCGLIRTMMDFVLGPHEFIQGVFLRDLKTALRGVSNEADPPIVLFSDCPDNDFTSFICQEHVPCVIFVDDFRRVVGESIQNRNMSAAEAIRFATQVVCSLESLSSQDILMLTPEWLSVPLATLIAGLSKFYELGDEPEIVEKLFRHFGYETPRGPSVGAHFSRLRSLSGAQSSEAIRLPAEERSFIAEVAGEYAGIGLGAGRARVGWPTELFLDWDRPGKFLRGGIGLLGPARFIICGPYLHLPRGRWECHVVIEVEDNLSGNRLGMDAFSGRILRGVTMDLPSSGVFDFVMPVEIENPFLPLELRFQILNGAIEGRLTLHEVSFHAASFDVEIHSDNYKISVPE